MRGCAIVLAVVVVLVAVTLFVAVREDPAWRRAYAEIKPGMTVEDVQMRFVPLRPRRTSRRPGGFEKKRADFHLFFDGPNNWQYVILFGADDRVKDKVKWWD